MRGEASGVNPPRPRRTQRERRETTAGELVDAAIASRLAVGYAKTTVKIASRLAVRHAKTTVNEVCRQTAARRRGAAPDLLEAFLFTALHTFDGESLTRVVLPRPEAEGRSMALPLRALGAALGR